MLSTMDEFFQNYCGGEKFLDLNVTWHTKVPEFSTCFRKTFLVVGPCFVFWIILPFQLRRISTSKFKPHELSKLGVVKTVSSLALITIAAFDFINNVFKSDVTPMDVIDPIIRLITFMTIFGLVYSERRAGLRISPVQFIFWFLYLTVQSLELYSYVLQYLKNDLQMLSAFTFMVSMLFVLASFICHFYSEFPSEGHHQIKSDQCPEMFASFPSLMTLSWMDGLCWTGYKKALTQNDLWLLGPPYNADSVVPMFQLETKKTHFKFQNKIKIMTALVRSFGKDFLFGGAIKLFHDILVFIPPLLLKQIIKFTATQDPIWHGVLITFLLLFTSAIQAVALSRYFYLMYILGLQVKTAMISAVYRKSMKISSDSKTNSTSGEVVILMAIDTQRIVDMIPNSNMIWSAPFQIISALYFLWQILGPSVLAGFFMMLLLIPMNIFLAAISKKLQTDQMKEKDNRVKMMNEILQGIKVLKLYAWEPSFEDKITAVREKEMKILRKIGYLSTIVSFVFSCAPFMVSLVTFATYVLSSPNNILNPENAFVSISLFNIINISLDAAPGTIMSFVQGGVALKRIDNFMNVKELRNDVEIDPSSDSGEKDGNALEIDSATFQWGNHQATPTLSNINLKVKTGSLVAVVGAVGVGKSSLLSAILGEMEKVSGNIKLRGSVAYTAQQAWIQNCTVKENIVLHLPSDEDRYQMSIEACALKPDIEVLPGGDETEIGENGINLSGGQKQRLSIARSVYSDADVHLFDDPLSAVDSHVGRHIFNKVIGNRGLLAGKTRILVTHNITLLPEADSIIVMKNGKISETGTFTQLMELKGAMAEILGQLQSKQMEENPVQPDHVNNIGKNQPDKEVTVRNEEIDKQIFMDSGSLNLNLNDSPDDNVVRHRKRFQVKEVPQIHKEETKEETRTFKQYEAEKMETGKVKLSIYLYYMKNMGIGMFIATIVFFTFGEVFSVCSNVWLSKWADASNDLKNCSNQHTEGNTTEYFLGIYGALGFIQAFTVVVGALCLHSATLQGGKKLHEIAMRDLLHLPMCYFDTTLQGQIINRFGKDVDVLDYSMPLTLRLFINGLLAVSLSFLVITYTTSLFVAPIVVITGIYYLILRVYIATSRQLKRLESVSRSPIYSHFGQTVNGMTTIRAFNLQETFIRKLEAIVDENQRAYFPSIVANRWLSIRLETIGDLIVFCAALLAVLGRDTISPGLVGLSITYALSNTQMLNTVIRKVSELETNIVAVERLKEFSDIEKEAEWKVEAAEPDIDWPHDGKIEFKNFSSRYRDGLDLVLHQISFKISSGEKVGIVGRTGAGKSSLVLSLFRILEAAEGSIYIDDIDISTLGLHQLRNKLTIIPQDPILFSGSLRMNIDPFNKYSLDQLWSALKISHLDSFVRSLPGGLEYVISEGGTNLSIGQRQLVCLTRALLRKTKILILDEATAAVDVETDALIQSTIKNEFSKCTILTIAHRLTTIVDYNKILVLSDGKIVEYDSPKNLLANTNTSFYSMSKEAGII